MNKQQEELRKKSPVQIKNRKASFEYFFIEEFTAGIVLTGTERTSGAGSITIRLTAGALPVIIRSSESFQVL